MKFEDMVVLLGMYVCVNGLKQLEASPSSGSSLLWAMAGMSKGSTPAKSKLRWLVIALPALSLALLWNLCCIPVLFVQHVWAAV
jgi:hypothetical protein